MCSFLQLMSLRGGIPVPQAIGRQPSMWLRNLSAPGSISMARSSCRSMAGEGDSGSLAGSLSYAQAHAPFLTKAGVIGTISVPNPKDMDVRWERSKLARVMPSIVLADPATQERANLQITLQVNPASLDKLLAGSGRHSP